MKKKPYIRVLGVVFVTFYLLAMILSTGLEKNKFEMRNSQNLDAVIDIVYSELEWMHGELVKGDQSLIVSENEFLKEIVSTAGRYLDVEEEQRFSLAIYTREGGKIAQTSSLLRIAEYSYNLEEYFSEEEFAFFQQVFLDRMANEAYESLEEKRPDWRIHAYVNEETGELAKLFFTSEEMKSIDELDYETPNTKTKWSWVNPDSSVIQNLKKIGEYPHMSYYIDIPYYRQGKQEYEKWLNNEFLQEFPEIWNEVDSGGYYEKIGVEEQVEFVGTMKLNEREWRINVRYVASPLLQAMNSLKYLYIGSAIFIAACLWITLRSLNKFNEQRRKLETTRRDFTNAIAHELKTPLGIIRGFAENSLENTNESKREYYLKQIVGQTEEMDKLVKEMVYISKLDSEDVFVGKERLHIEDIVKEQLNKLELLSDEKNLDIKLKVNNDFEIFGDKKYLERAIWNLLINAIEYNQLDGFIEITIDKTRFTIENSGVKIGDDELPHVFDMFYTSDKSRSFSDKHMGLGLYLAKKIFELHKMNITIRNVENGVEVVVIK